jgi:hypothetical protein
MKQFSVMAICVALLSVLSPAVGMKLNEPWLQKRQESAVTHAPADVLTPVAAPTLAAPPVAVATGTSFEPTGNADM